MTKDVQTRSSISGPEVSPSPRNLGAETPDPAQNSDDHMADPGQSEGQAQISHSSSEAAVPTPNTGESQPMTATDTASAASSAKDTMIPYGTRSRNRTGNSRPNYAEDKDLDAELEAASSGKERKSARGNDNGNAVEAGRTSVLPRKVPDSDADHATVPQNHHKDPLPGTLTFSANPSVATAPNASTNKKRKATTQSAAVQHQSQAPMVTPVASQPATRRSSMAAQVIPGIRESNMLSFDTCGGRLKNKKLVADDGTTLEVNDHVYLICEPPGEPYYLGRIMEFLHTSNDSKQPIDALRLNWYYRPKDIGRKVNDTRQVFASMHSDVSPLTSLRGKCQIKHKSEVDKLDEVRRMSDCFWYEKLYDRYIHRFYDVVPTSQVINVPTEVKKVLDERWKYIIVEPSRGKELTSAVKSCKRCNKYCASNDSVDCAVCQNTYHMSCVSPPLLKKPSRGFAWACGPCSKAQEKKLEARNTPSITDPMIDAEEEEFNDEETGTPGHAGDTTDTGQTSPLTSSDPDVSLHPGTAEQIHQASLWLFRYLGIHCKVEDALDYDDRIYPRASSRLGPKHQANIPTWPGRPFEYVKPADIKKKYLKGANHKKDAKLAKETIAALEADKLAREQRPKWVVDEPPGYVHRGEDLEVTDPNCTSQLLYRLPGPSDIPDRIANAGDAKLLSEASREQIVFDYMGRAAAMAKSLNLPPLSTNLLDVALEILQSNAYDVERALDALARVDRKIFKEPELTPTEAKKFEDGVSKYGSEWHSIKKHVKTVSPADVVRLYYTWKKTDRGKQIWGNYTGRKGKKEAKKAEATIGKLQDDVADEYDDSAFDNDKAFEKKKAFQCKFCATRSSRQWRRAPNTVAGTRITDLPGTKSTSKEKGVQVMVALCWRCAELWRRYAIQWEDVDEASKKVAQAGGRSWKRKIDEEVLKELVAANEIMNRSADTLAVPSTGSTPTSQSSNTNLGPEPARKKARLPTDHEAPDHAANTPNAVIQKKKAAPEKPVVAVPPPPPPEPPKAKVLPCAICGELEPLNEQHISCKDCRMAVHRNCYGVVGENRSPKWVCDMCSNDKNPQVSIQYQCMLCPIEYTQHDLVEPPKVSHKKKTDKDRERDRLEREHAQSVADYFQKKQEELNKPLNPREPLKRTVNNNWVHVTCAVFHPEVKFGNAKALEPSEGIPSIPSSRYEETCKVCKQQNKGACVNCHSCRTPVHVECAHQAGYILGFDITPIKGSRREQFNIVNVGGESGTMAAAIWCKDHVPTKTIVHYMHDIVDGTGLNALQLYVQNFKQADLALTGTVRKATLVNQSTKITNPAVVSSTPNRRASTTNNSHSTPLTLRGSISQVKFDGNSGSSAATDVMASSEKACATCKIDISPKWWPFPLETTSKPDEPPVVASIEPNETKSMVHEPFAINGLRSSEDTKENGETYGALAAAALHRNGAPPKMAISTEFQCHQCHFKKARKNPTPPSALPPPEPLQEPDPPRPLIGLSPSTISIPTPDRETVQLAPSPYAWPPSTTLSSSGLLNGSSYSWSGRSPVPQNVGHVGHVNGHRSPHLQTGVVQMPHQQQNHFRQPGHGAHASNHITTTPNGYPSSPHRVPHVGSHVHQSNHYGTYGNSRPPPPQHLTNGGPPPRAPDSPFIANGTSVHHRLSFGSQQANPPTFLENRGHSRESSHGQINGFRSNDGRPNEARLSEVRSIDGRVNGGASASPSLRNLLS